MTTLNLTTQQDYIFAELHGQKVAVAKRFESPEVSHLDCEHLSTFMHLNCRAVEGFDELQPDTAIGQRVAIYNDGAGYVLSYVADNNDGDNAGCMIATSRDLDLTQDEIDQINELRSIQGDHFKTRLVEIHHSIKRD